MKQFKILEVQAENFKGFRKIVHNLSSSYFSILGGKNGYGKTTIFDIIELVLTGGIRRYSSYVKQNDGRLKLSAKELPLVHDTNQRILRVQLKVLIDERIFWLKRECLIGDMKNPVSFTPLAKLYCRQDEEEGYSECSLGECLPNGESIIDRFNFIHYIEQEESNLFLKKSGKDRVEDINRLFDTESYDRDLHKIKDIKAELKNITNSLNSDILKKKQEIDALKSTINKENAEGINFGRLFKKDIPWDREDPEFSIEQFHSIVEKNGILDSFRYFLKYKTEYRRFQISSLLEPYLSNPNRLNTLTYQTFFGLHTADVMLYEL